MIVGGYGNDPEIVAFKAEALSFCRPCNSRIDVDASPLPLRRKLRCRGQNVSERLAFVDHLDAP